MLSLEEYKKTLGKVADELSEEELLKAQKIQDELAEILFVIWKEVKLEAKKKIETQCQILLETKTVSSIAA